MGSALKFNPATVNGVSIQPGATAFTLICGANSSAKALVNESTAPLVAT